VRAALARPNLNGDADALFALLGGLGAAYPTVNV
jgi:hypothetical protein